MRPISLRSRLWKIVAGLIGVLVALVAIGLSMQADLRRASDGFIDLGIEIETLVTRRLDNLHATLRSLSGMHHAMDQISQQELSAFAQDIENTYPYVKAILHMRLVDAEGRLDFEQEMRDSGYPTFQIHAGENSETAFDKGAPRTRHMALDVIEPLDPSLARALGYDFYADPRLSHAIDQAIRSGKVTAAPSEPVSKNAFLLFKAVYKGFFVPNTARERRSQMHGAYALLVDAPAFFDDILRQNPSLGLHLHKRDDDQLTQLFTKPLTPATDSFAQLFPKHRVDMDIALPASNFQVAIERTRDASSLRPLRWIWEVATFLGLYLALVLVVFTRLRAAEAAREAKEQLFQEKERAQVTLQSIGEAVITTDPTGIVDFMNPAAEQLTGWQADLASHHHLNEIFSLVTESDGSALPDPIARALRDHDESEVAAIMVRSDSASVAVIENAAAIRNSEGQFTGAALIIRDVSRERSLLREMAFQASHDSLTRLINRREFERELAAVVDDALNGDNEHALMYIDLDQFKTVNDTCGHIAGDQLLKQVAAHMGENIRRLDRLARLGGDEFGVLLRDCTLDKALQVAEALRQDIKDLRLRWEERSFRISLSIGVIAITKDSGNLDEVMRAADAACYAAKDQGRDRIHIYQPNDDLLAQRSTDMQWLQKLREAIDNDSLTLYGQTIYPLQRDSSRPTMCELLVRMLDSDGRPVPPMAFIPAAERFNLMFDLDLWVVGSAFKQLGRLWAERPDDQRIFTINLSGQSLDHPDLVGAIQDLELTYQIDPRRICFEITETSVIANMERALDLMDELRWRGFLFALDDFGTGLSSFAYLKKMPVQYLKIDGEFVRDILQDPVDKAMVDTIKRIGGVLGMHTIAEAIEDNESCQLLTAMGIDYGQGYHLSRPAPDVFDLAPVLRMVRGKA